MYIQNTFDRHPPPQRCVLGPCKLHAWDQTKNKQRQDKQRQQDKQQQDKQQQDKQRQDKQRQQDKQQQDKQRQDKRQQQELKRRCASHKTDTKFAKTKKCGVFRTGFIHNMP